MKTYLVGGAVRDKLLGLPISERDWVVVGATKEEMLDRGFRQVGSEFPVFLHPESNEEYALARTERKTKPGHRGFQCRSDPNVTLEEDLGRRDLRINAIAETETGTLIDPHDGLGDIKKRSLRHISESFKEDPLRILRVARFKAKFDHLNFSIRQSTTELVKAMVANNEHKEVSAERILMELDKALITKTPAEFFRYLNKVGADSTLWPEISRSAYGRLESTSVVNPNAKFAILLLDLSPTEIQKICRRLKTSKNRLEVTTLITTLIKNWSNVEKLSPEARVDLVEKADGIRKNERFNDFNLACDEITGKSHADYWKKIRDTMSSVKAKDLKVKAKGPDLGKLIRKEQIRKIRELQ